MSSKLSYLTINGKDLKSLYKLYYTKKLIKSLAITNTTKNSTNFIFYGTIIAMSPLNRIEYNKLFSKEESRVSVNLSIRPYSNFKSLIRFSHLNKITIRLKGDVFFQIKITFKNDLFKPNQSIFETQAIRFNYINSRFNEYINTHKNDSKSTKIKPISPSIMYIISESSTSFVRYNSINNWINLKNFSTNQQLSFELITRINYSQNKLIEVAIYNQSHKYTTIGITGLIA